MGILKKRFPNIPILGLTAIPTHKTIIDCVEILGIRGCRLFSLKDYNSIIKKNINFTMEIKESNVLDDITHFINKYHKNNSGICKKFKYH